MSAMAIMLSLALANVPFALGLQAKSKVEAHMDYRGHMEMHGQALQSVTGNESEVHGGNVAEEESQSKINLLEEENRRLQKENLGLQAVASSQLGNDESINPPTRQDERPANDAEAPTSAKLLYIGIMSAPGNHRKRDAIRSSYLRTLQQQHMEGCTSILAEFLIGHEPFTIAEHQQGALAAPKALVLEEHIEKEIGVHGDIRRIALPEKYENLPDKVLQFLQHGVDLQYKFMMKIDDDQALNFDLAKQFATHHDSNELIYAGINLWSHKSYKSQEGPDGSFVPYFGGPCYLLSWKLAHQIIDEHGTNAAEFIRYGSSSEDVDMGRWVQWEATQGAKVTYKTIQFSTALSLSEANTL